MCISPFGDKQESVFSKMAFKEGKYCIEAANTMTSNCCCANRRESKLSQINSRLSFLNILLAWAISISFTSMPVTDVKGIAESLDDSHPLPQPTSKIFNGLFFSQDKLPAFATTACVFSTPRNGYARYRYPAETLPGNRSKHVFRAALRRYINPRMLGLTAAYFRHVHQSVYYNIPYLITRSYRSLPNAIAAGKHQPGDIDALRSKSLYFRLAVFPNFLQ